ncbi:MAG: redoxin domain-containing protein [Candidatus Poribacteria bacterium]|nr:redoxin domain-containing protein [Candidatus Poribacteria bacterium]
MESPTLFTSFFTHSHLIVEKSPPLSTVLHRLCIVFVLFVTSTSFGLAQEKVEKVKLDAVVKNFTLKDATGTPHTLYKLSEEKSATVVLFLATQCPIVTDYAERIVTLAKTYGEKNVQFIGINSNRQEKVKEILEYSEKHKFEFTVLKDPENDIADYFGARRTPEIFLIDAKRALRYMGAIDNSPKEPTKHYLQNALDLVIAGENISKESKRTRAVGCTIKRVRKTSVDRTP